MLRNSTFVTDGRTCIVSAKTTEYIGNFQINFEKTHNFFRILNMQIKNKNKNTALISVYVTIYLYKWTLRKRST